MIFEPIDRCEIPQIHDPIVRERIERRKNDIPAVLTRELQTFSAGANYLIERWIELAEMLKFHGYWHYPEKYRALRMFGRNPEDVCEDLLVQDVYLACSTAHPDHREDDPDHLSFFDECFQSKLCLEGKPMYFGQINKIKTLKPEDRTSAQAILWSIFEVEIKRLRELKTNHLDPINAANRAGAQARAMFDGSKEGVLLRRYETACDREFHKACGDLQKFRKANASCPEFDEPEAPVGPEIRNEPVAEVVTESPVTPPAPVPATPPTPREPRPTHKIRSKRNTEAFFPTKKAPPNAP